MFEESSYFKLKCTLYSMDSIYYIRYEKYVTKYFPKKIINIFTSNRKVEKAFRIIKLIKV